MYTEETARFVKLTLKISSYLGTSPHLCSDEEQVVEFPGSRTVRYFDILAQVFLDFTYFAFVIARLVQITIFYPSTINWEKIGLQYIAVTYAIPAAYHFCLMINADQLDSLTNRIIRYQQFRLSLK